MFSPVLVCLHLCQALSSDSHIDIGLRVRHGRALPTDEGLILLGHPSIEPSLSYTKLDGAVEKYSSCVSPFILGVSAGAKGFPILRKE